MENLEVFTSELLMGWQQNVGVSNDDYIAFDEDETINLTNLRVDDIQEEKRIQINGLDDNDYRYESTLTTGGIEDGWSKEFNYTQVIWANTHYVGCGFRRGNYNNQYPCCEHLNKSIPEEISDSDTDFDPIFNNNTKKSISNNRIRKYSPLKLTKKIQSTLDFPIIKASTNINKSTFNKCGPYKCSDCGMLYYIGGDEDDSIHSKFHKEYMDKFEHGYYQNISLEL